MAPRHLTHEQLLRVHQAITELHLAGEQTPLLSGIPAEYVATLPSGSPSASLLQRLNVLNEVVALNDGSVPLEMLLRNASLLAGPRVQSAVFEDALSELRRVLPRSRASVLKAPESDCVDVVILTAIPLEFAAVLQVASGAWDERPWDLRRTSTGLPIAFRLFRARGGAQLRVAVTQAPDAGLLSATATLLSVLHEFPTRCIAMAGVCAGRPGKTNLGDVVAADRLFLHDTGKQVEGEVLQDLMTFNVRRDWKIALEQQDFLGVLRDQPWWRDRPIPYLWQENWILKQLIDGVERPDQLKDQSTFCPQWERAIANLWRSGDVADGTMAITAQGESRIRRVLVQYKGGLPDTGPTGSVLPFRVHVAPMGSGQKVIEESAIWGFVSAHMRKTLGLEMEAAALGAIAELQREKQIDAIVMKGVMDFAEQGRDDHFKEYAARAAAECLLTFLREQLGGGQLVEGKPSKRDQVRNGPAAVLPGRHDHDSQIRGLSEAAAQLISTKPIAWEHRLFAQVFTDEVARHRDARRDFDNGFAWTTGDVLSPPATMTRLGAEMRAIQEVPAAVARVMTQVLPVALGQPGEDGNPEELIYAGRRLGEIYRRAIDWGLGVMRLPVRSEFDRTKQIISRLATNMIHEIEAYSARITNDLASGLDEHARNAERGIQGPVVRRAILTLTVSESLAAELDEEFRRLMAKFRSGDLVW